MIDEGKAFRENEFEGEAQDAVKQTGHRPERIILERDHRREDGRAFRRWRKFHRVEAEIEAPRRYRLSEVARRCQHRPGGAVDEKGEKFGRLRSKSRSVIDESKGS